MHVAATKPYTLNVEWWYQKPIALIVSVKENYRWLWWWRWRWWWCWLVVGSCAVFVVWRLKPQLSWLTQQRQQCSSTHNHKHTGRNMHTLKPKRTKKNESHKERQRRAKRMRWTSITATAATQMEMNKSNGSKDCIIHYCNKQMRWIEPTHKQLLELRMVCASTVLNICS